MEEQAFLSYDSDCYMRPDFAGQMVPINFPWASPKSWKSQLYTVVNKVEVSVEQLSIHSVHWQALLAAFSEKSQVRFGGLHCACLRVYELLDTFPAYLYQGYALALFQELPLPRFRTSLSFSLVLWGFCRHETRVW